MSLYKKILIILSSILGVFILALIGYISYVWFQYYRIEDNLTLEINNNTLDEVERNKEYTITTFNIGFGAYDQTYSFFLDKGTMKDGTKKVGKYAKATSYDIVDSNMNGIIESMKKLNPDFMLFQEVDSKATRSYYINEHKRIEDEFNNHASIYASCFHTAYLLYPFNDFMGSANTGITTFSKYKVKDATRYQLPLSKSKFDNLFDLDRCFSITRLKVTDTKDLVLLNIHMSAYDKGGKVKVEQLALLNKTLEQEKNNYVIVGGDFNHVMADPITPFPMEQLIPSHAKHLTNEELTNGYSIVTGRNAPTCRSCDIPYTKGINYTTILDAFIVNENIEVVDVTNIDLDFKNSDHNPVKLTFKLK